ncbi:signal peptidase I [soil metagenome]
MNQDRDRRTPSDALVTSDALAAPPAARAVTPATAADPIEPSSRHRAKKPPKKGSLLKELPILLIVAFVLALVIKSFIVQAFFIPSGSMEPTLHGCVGCSGDRVMVNKVVYNFTEPKPGEIVVFRGPDSWAPEFAVQEPTNPVQGALLALGRAIGTAPPNEKDFIKRVIATGGQTVACCDDDGRLTVDDEPLTEPYIDSDSPLEARGFGPITVPEGRLWVMGDNRAGSADSRSHVDDGEMGTVAVDDVIGRAAVIVWPPSRAGLLHAPDIQVLGAAGSGGLGAAGSGGLAVAAPYLLGLAVAVPVTGLRSRRR